MEYYRRIFAEETYFFSAIQSDTIQTNESITQPGEFKKTYNMFAQYSIQINKLPSENFV